MDLSTGRFMSGSEEGGMEEDSWEKNLPVPISSRRATNPSTELIGQFLVECGEIYGQQITSAKVAIYQREFGHLPPTVARKATRAALRNCQFFPTIADVYRFVPHDAKSEKATMLYSGPPLLDYGDPRTVLGSTSTSSKTDPMPSCPRGSRESTLPLLSEHGPPSCHSY